MLLLVMIALGLMVIDHKLKYFSKVRSNLNLIVVPIQFMVNWPAEFIHRMSTSLSTKQQLLTENAKLRAQQLLLQAKLQRLLAIESENTQLRQLLSSSYHINDRVLVAEILAIDLDPFSQQVVLNQGSIHGVYIGQPVLDANGVMGQVVVTGPVTSQVLLITDSRSAIPVQDNRSGVRAIAIGTDYTDRLKLLHVADTADIKVSDLMVTSGLGQRYPFGYPVGVVTSMQHISGEHFAQIRLRPSAHVDRARQVLLVWHHSMLSKNSIQPLPMAPGKES